MFSLLFKRTAPSNLWKWSLGCVGYFILTGGWQPFLTNQVDLPYGGEIWRNYESNMRNGWIKWPMETNDTQITNEAKWLIHTLLDLEPQNRPTLGECLKHLQDSWVEHDSDLDNWQFWGSVPKRDQNTMPRRWPQLPFRPRQRSPPPPTPRLDAHHESPS
jgi:serine/threonine protein kinase